MNWSLPIWKKKNFNGEQSWQLTARMEEWCTLCMRCFYGTLIRDCAEKKTLKAREKISTVLSIHHDRNLVAYLPNVQHKTNARKFSREYTCSHTVHPPWFYTFRFVRKSSWTHVLRDGANFAHFYAAKFIITGSSPKLPFSNEMRNHDQSWL